MDLQSFKAIEDKMRWKGAALTQIDRLSLLAAGIGAPVKVVGSHTSKSIELPVVELLREGHRFLLRDNFYDLNVCVLAAAPITLPIGELFRGIIEPLDWEWYLGEIARARGYSWKFWTDEQMNDPKLLKVTVTRESGVRQDWDTTTEEKARWAKRLTDPEWYCHDWSSGSITYDGEFGPEASLFVQRTAFAEGIGRLVSARALDPYSPGKSQFTVVVYEYEQVADLIHRICGD